MSRQRPATPKALDFAPEQELLFTKLIMDPRILESNLKRMGLDKQLKQNKVRSAKDVFLAACGRK